MVWVPLCFLNPCRLSFVSLWTSVSSAWFLTGGVFECDNAHRRSVAVLCMLYKIRCNPMRPLNDALPRPYVSVRVTLGALVAHRYMHLTSLKAPRSIAGLLFPSQCPSGTILLTQCSMVWGWLVSRAGSMFFFIGLSCSIPTGVFYYFSLSLLPVYTVGWYCEAAVFGLIGCISLSLSLALPTSFNNNNNNTIIVSITC